MSFVDVKKSLQRLTKTVAKELGLLPRTEDEVFAATAAVKKMARKRLRNAERNYARIMEAAAAEQHDNDDSVQKQQLSSGLSEEEQGDLLAYILVVVQGLDEDDAMDWIEGRVTSEKKGKTIPIGQ